ncbi:MAG TPA: magnesium transporter CorA family protein [Gemmatimonadaceae bacterium]
MSHPAPPDQSPATPAESRLPRSFFCDEAGTVTRNLDLRELAACARQGKGTLWVDVDASARQQVALLEKVFGFHALAIEDVLNPSSRVKVEEYDDFLFVVLREVRIDEATDDPYDLHTANLYFFIGANYLVTAHRGTTRHIDAVADVVNRSPDMLRRSPARLAHQIMDEAVDAFFPLLDWVDEFLDTLEERIFEQFDQSALRDIFAVKRMVLSLRRYLAPEREIFNVLTNRPSRLLPPEVQLYYRDIYDHVLRINDSLETYRDLLSSTLESYLSQVSNQLGRVTKGLTVVATLSVPFVVVSGMWGMNLRGLPLAGHPLGFGIMLALQVGLAVALMWALRRKGLL